MSNIELGGNVTASESEYCRWSRAVDLEDAIIGQGVLIFRGGVEWPMLLGVRETGSSHMWAFSKRWAGLCCLLAYNQRPNVSRIDRGSVSCRRYYGENREITVLLGIDAGAVVVFKSVGLGELQGSVTAGILFRVSCDTGR